MCFNYFLFEGGEENSMALTTEMQELTYADPTANWRELQQGFGHQQEASLQKKLILREQRYTLREQRRFLAECRHAFCQERLHFWSTPPRGDQERTFAHGRRAFQVR